MGAPFDERYRCTATARTTGGRCRNAATPGANVCRFHGGAIPAVRRAAERRLAMAEAVAELDKLGRTYEIDPASAMLAMVHEAAANVALYRRLVQRLGAGVDDLDDFDESGLGMGLAVRTGNSGKPAEAERHIWVRMYDEERERLVRWADMCRKAGVAEELVRIAEGQADAFERVLDRAMGLVFAAMRTRLPFSGGVIDTVAAEWPGLLDQAFREAGFDAPDDEGVVVGPIAEVGP